jgi:hypothetical protein
VHMLKLSELGQPHIAAKLVFQRLHDVIHALPFAAYQKPALLAHFSRCSQYVFGIEKLS